MAEVSLPDTQEYRVVVVGVLYQEPRIDHDLEGNARVIYVTQTAPRGAVVGLVPREAKRLQDLDAVRPADSPKGYDELDDEQAKAAAAARGLVVRSSGADADQPLREDYITALHNADLASDEAAGVGVGTTPGGILAVGPDGATRVDVPESAAAAFDPNTATVEQLSAHITDGKLNAADTVDLAAGDPTIARRVLDAEKAAQGGDSRATVTGPLQKIIDG